MKKQTLSNKLHNTTMGIDILSKEDVKDFIKKLKEELCGIYSLPEDVDVYAHLLKFINEDLPRLAGERLK